MLVPLFRMIYETLLGAGTVQIAEGPVFAAILAGHAFPIEHLPDITNFVTVFSCSTSTAVSAHLGFMVYLVLLVASFAAKFARPIEIFQGIWLHI